MAQAVEWTMTDSVKIIHLADVHYGSPRVDPASITAGLHAMLPMHKDWSDVDYLQVEGDFFDSDFRMADKAAGHAQAGMVYIIYFCSKFGIKLRILEGTPKHDRKQSANFLLLAQSLRDSLGISVDVKYIPDLHIEHDDELGIDMLYVPDERNMTAQDTFIEAVELMQTRGLERVHLGFLHGAWLHQMPIPHKAYHDAAQWSELVIWRVFCGHVHTHSEYLKITSVGSAGRNFHGEEEQKGALVTTHYFDGRYEKEFIPNPCARIFRTLEVNGLDHAAIRSLFLSENLPLKSAVRLRHDGSTAMATTVELLAEEYPDYSWTEISKKKEKEEDAPSALDEDVLEEPEYVPSITRDNILPMTENQLSTMDTRGYKSDELLALLDEVLNE